MVISSHIGHFHSSAVRPVQSPVDSRATGNKGEENEQETRIKAPEDTEKQEDGSTPETNNRFREQVNARANTAESELTEAEKKELRELRSRDREVRAHEQAHAAVAGSLAKGGPSYDYQRGPDGRLYAVGGEVQIDTSAVSGDPRATADKAQRIRRAALAPAQPSQQDRAIAAQAAAMEARARAEIAQQASEQADTEEPVVDDVAKTEAGGETQTEQGTSSEKTIDSHPKCAVCGGHHSAESHNHANESRIEQAVSFTQDNDQPGRLLSLTA